MYIKAFFLMYLPMRYVNMAPSRVADVPITASISPNGLSPVKKPNRFEIKHPNVSPKTDIGENNGRIHIASLSLSCITPNDSGALTKVKAVYKAPTIAMVVSFFVIFHTFLRATIFRRNKQILRIFFRTVFVVSLVVTERLPTSGTGETPVIYRYARVSIA